MSQQLHYKSAVWRRIGSGPGQLRVNACVEVAASAVCASAAGCLPAMCTRGPRNETEGSGYRVCEFIHLVLRRISDTSAPVVPALAGVQTLLLPALSRHKSAVLRRNPNKLHYRCRKRLQATAILLVATRICVLQQ